MKTIKRIIVALALVFGCIATSNAQKFAATLGYEYMQKHAGFLGAEYRIDQNDLHNNHGPLNVGIGTYLYGNNGKFAVAPEMHIDKTWWHFLSTECSVSTLNFKPSAGISFFNLFRLQFGYSIPFSSSVFEGFYFGFRVHIGRAPFYDEIRMF